MTEERLPPAHARVVVLVAAVAGLVALASSDAVHQAVLQVFEAAKGIMAAHPVAGATLFVLLAALSAMLAFFSSAVLVPAAVYAWGPVATAALLWLGWILGGLGAYALAWWAGRGAMHWVAPGRSFARYEGRFRERVSFGLVILFQLALPSEIPGFVLGLARYSLVKYLAALAIAELPYAVGTMLLGASFVTRDIGMLVGVGAAAAIGVVLVAQALGRRMA